MKRIVKVTEAPSDTRPAVPERTCEALGIQELEVSSGAERYSPVQFCSFEVPNVTVRVKPLPTETPSQCLARARAMVDGWSAIMYEEKLAEHAKRVTASRKGV